MDDKTSQNKVITVIFGGSYLINKTQIVSKYVPSIGRSLPVKDF